jgi:SulP family sulfate permease
MQFYSTAFLFLVCLTKGVACFNPSHSKFVVRSPISPTALPYDSNKNKDQPELAIPSSDDSSQPPPSTIESVVENAKLLWRKTDDRADTFVASSAAGLAVALAMVPEAVAFSFVAGVNPLVGLWTTVTLGLVAAALGGRAGICSSASGACSVVVASLCAMKGPAYLSACAMLAGLFQIAGGILGLGKFIRLVPHPVMLGFVNGLAVLMTKSQLVHFKGLSLSSKTGLATYGLTALTMALVKMLPKATKVLPPTLGAVAFATLLTAVFKLPVTKLTDVAGASTFVGGWNVIPAFGIPSIVLSWETSKTILPFAITMAAVGSIESLLTMQLLDGMMDDGKRGSTRREMLGQGAGNMVSGLFGGIGGCALLGQSIINVQSGGGASRWSGMSMALFLAAGIVVAAPLLGAVPMASLVGVMLLVCQSTFSWSSLRIINKIPKLDAAVIALVSVITVQRDLAQAVVAGTIASALGFAWKQSTNLSASSAMVYDRKLYRLNGPLFFGSTTEFSGLFDSKADPEKIVLDFSNCRVMDHSALDAIQSLADQYGQQGKIVYLRHLSSDCARRLSKLYESRNLPSYEIVENDLANDPVYGIA